MSNQSLSSLIWEATQVERAIAENGGELTKDLEISIDQLAVDTADKIDGYDFVMTKILHTAEWYQEQAKTYEKLAKTQKNFCERLKERMKWVMTQSSLVEISGNRVRFRLAKRDPKVVIDDERKLPLNLMKQVTEIVPDKDKIKAMLKDGLEVKGARLEEVYTLTKYINRADIGESING